MVDILSAMAEIRRGKKKEETTDAKYNVHHICYAGGRNKTVLRDCNIHKGGKILTTKWTKLGTRTTTTLA